MTCIVAIESKGKIYWGADSAVSSYEQRIMETPKIFEVGGVVFGGSGSLRMLQIIQYHFKALKHKPHKTDIEYLISRVVPSIRVIIKKHGKMGADKSMDETDAYFLIGYNSRVYKLGMGFSILPVVDDYNAIGSGQSYALGALRSTEDGDRTPADRAALALEAAGYFCDSVAPPYRIFVQDNTGLAENY